MIQRHQQEMSISHKDFHRLLPIALKSLKYDVVDEEIHIVFTNGNIQINPGREHERKIASLVLPVLHVNFTFTDIATEDMEQFLADFNRTYQRGGG